MAFSSYSVLLLPICSAIAPLLCLGARTIGWRLGLLDVPGGRKSHRKPTPLMGGVCLLVGFFPWAALWMIANPQPADALLPALACAAALTLVGLADDRFDLPATLRLATCLLLTTATLWISPELVLRTVSWNLDGGSVVVPLALPLTALGLTALVQAANLADGKNGLLIGMSLAWLSFLTGLLPGGVFPILTGFAAVLVVLLAFNLGGRLFLGDGGSYGLSTFVGFLALHAAGTRAVPGSTDQIALVFLLPVLDMARLFIVRLAGRRSPFAADRDHLHHHLLAAFGWPGGLVVYLLLVGIPPFVAFGAPRNTLAIIALTVASYFAVIAHARFVTTRKAAARHAPRAASGGEPQRP